MLVNHDNPPRTVQMGEDPAKTNQCEVKATFFHECARTQAIYVDWKTDGGCETECDGG